MSEPAEVIDIEEVQKAILYRDQWDAKIAYRAAQLQQYRGSGPAFQALWENWQNIYRPENFISGLQTPEGELDIHGEEGSYLTPYDVDTNGNISSSPVRVTNAKHASTQNDHPYPAE